MSHSVDAHLRTFMRALALRVARRPPPFAAVPLIFALVCASGLPLLRTESEYIKLWYPTDTPQVRNVRMTVPDPSDEKLL